MLEVVFSELYDKEAKELQVSREETLAALTNPDKTEEILYEDLIIRLFLKREHERNSYLLILAQLKNEKLFLYLPLRIMPDLFPSIHLLEPLMILELFAQRFGLVMNIGDYFGRFIYIEDIPLQNDMPEFRVLNPDNHPFLQSFFVKILPTTDGKVAKVALAFCIDKAAYKMWLLSHGSMQPKKSMLPQEILPITRIISNEEIKEIIANTSYERDPKKRFNLVELGLALQIIRKVMGIEWYQRVLRRFEQGTTIPDKEYWRLVKSNKIHPLSEALWSGHPEQYIKIIQLAQYLNQLWRKNNSNNLLKKIVDLRKCSFEHTFYELKIAASLDRRGFPVTFIKEEKYLKTPDFRVDSIDGFAYCECKKKETTSLQVDSDIEKAMSQIENYGGPGIIFIELLQKVDDEKAENIFNRATTILEGSKKISLLILTSEELAREGEMIALRTKVYGIENKQAHFKVPESIKKACMFQDPIRWFPLSQSLQQNETD
ncbi:MAG: hypothetical protein QW707_09180 [Candidatus Bathyarchaeia archaeon]